MWLRVYTTLPEDLSSDPSTHVKQLSTTWNYSSRRSDIPASAGICTCAHRHRQIHINITFKTKVNLKTKKDAHIFH